MTSLYTHYRVRIQVVVEPSGTERSDLKTDRSVTDDRGSLEGPRPFWETQYERPEVWTSTSWS